MKVIKIGFVLSLLFSSTFLVPLAIAITNSQDSIQTLSDGNGIRINVRDIELYFNATNGGEITEYFDLTVDPTRSRNLVNMGWEPWYNLLPLFTSLFYNPYNGLIYSTGGDPSANLWLISETSEQVLLQSSSRIMSRAGAVAKDVSGKVIYVNSIWIIRNSGLISVERTFFVPNYAKITDGWRWYPFYLTRDAGFDNQGTFFMFNTTYAYDEVVSQTSYENIFNHFAIIPNDIRHVHGVAFPFSETSIGGDGTHNILIAYKYDEFLNVDGWRSDNYHSNTNDVIEGGAVYEFDTTFNAFTHTYHALLNFTHQSINSESLQNFADYYANDPTIAWPVLMECSVTTNKDVYNPGDYFVFNGSGTSYFNLNGVTARVTVKNSLNRNVYLRDYGPGDITSGQTFNIKLLDGTVSSAYDSYTILFQLFSSTGIEIASDQKVFTVVET